jgi:acyl-CoA synthetase (AMP-forming)/AMP-acid ligase II
VPDPVAGATFADVLAWRAAQRPDATAFTWLGTGSHGSNSHGASDGDVTLTYAELDGRAWAIAELLMQEGPAGERALLLFAPGLDFIAALFGCFYAGWIAVPAYPPPLNQRLGRIQAVARDAQPLLALTSEALLSQVTARIGSEPDLQHLGWRSIDHTRASSQRHASLDSASRDRHPSVTPASFNRHASVTRPKASVERHASVTAASFERQGGPADVAVLQYTSGSTAAPRGVMLTHANLLHNTAQIAKRFGILPAQSQPRAESAPGYPSRGVIWLPPYHDMGLVGGILEGVFGGFPISLMAPVAFLQRPRRWLEAISRTHATISGGPNFAYDLCVDRIPASERAGLDLSSWQVAFNGSEPVRESTLRRFTEAFGGVGFCPTAFYPCYGLAEATLMVAGGSATAEPVVVNPEGDRTVVGCGQAIDDQQVLIVDPSTRTPCDTGQVGEIWVTGPSVAAGYWNQPELTEEVFDAQLRDPSPNAAQTRYLRTGDLGFVVGGELFISGRLKAVLILGGRKIQAEDIEATLALAQAQTTLRPAGVVAMGVEADNSERLVIIQELSTKHLSQAELEETAKSIRARVAEAHQLPVWAVVLTRAGGVPRTSSGKVQRATCREAFLNHQLQPLYEWRATPEKANRRNGA